MHASIKTALAQLMSLSQTGLSSFGLKVKVIHPLNDSTVSLLQDQRQSYQKHTKNDQACTDREWLCNVLVVDAYGMLGE